MATTLTRGEVWLFDLGMVAKVRPCLVLSIPAGDENDRVLTTLVPHEGHFTVLESASRSVLGWLRENA